MGFERVKRALRKYPRTLDLALGAWRTAKLPFQWLAGLRLKGQLNSLSANVPKVWYFGYPTHPNLGDQAQRVCIELWLKECFPDFDVIPITTWSFAKNPKMVISVIESKLSESDFFLMQSGYTMNDGNLDEVAHRLVPCSFPDRPVLFMPQTIYYTDEGDKELTAKALSGRRNVLLLCRDEVSYRTAKSLFPETALALYPDIVTTLIGETDYSMRDRNGVMFCVRNDSEKCYSEGQISELVSKIGANNHVDVSDTTIGKGDINWDDSNRVVQAVRQVISNYANYEVVVTDRFHGTIFSLAAGTPVIVLKTTDHKVTAGANWFVERYKDYIHIAGSLEEVPSLVQRIGQLSLDHKLPPYFTEQYYSKLRDLVVETTKGWR